MNRAYKLNFLSRSPFGLAFVIFLLFSLCSYGVALFLASVISQSRLVATQEWLIPIAVLGAGACIYWLKRASFSETPTPNTDRYWVVGITLLLHLGWWWLIGVDFAGDGSGYLRNYLQLNDATPVYYTQQLYWTPFSGIFYGGLLDLGGLGAIVIGQLLLALSASLLIFQVGQHWGRTAAWLMIFFWWAHLGNQMHYHLVGADGLLMYTAVIWLFCFVQAMQKQKIGWWFGVGLAIGLNTLVRSGNITLVVGLGAALFPIWENRAWRTSVLQISTTILGISLLLVPFVVYNGLRYDRFQLARGSNAVWFSAAFFPDSVMSPDAGEASRQLADLVEQHLLTTDVYEGVTVEQFFSIPSHRTRDDAQSLVDRYIGWETDYGLLRDAAFEGMQDRPMEFLRYRVRDLVRQMVVKDVLVNIDGCTECEVEIVERPYSSYFLNHPDGSVPSPEVVAEADAELLDFIQPILQDHYRENQLKQVNEIWIRFGISPILWLIFIPVALWLGDWKTRWLIFFLVLAQLSINIPTSMVVPQARYRLPFDPFLILITVIAVRQLIDKLKNPENNAWQSYQPKT